MIKGRSISMLSALDEISADTQFLVSQYSISSDSLYYQVEAKYDTIETNLSTDIDVESIKLSVEQNLRKAASVSGNFEVFESSVDEFGDKFDENEHLTRKLPRFIEETAQYERQIVDVLDKDKCVRPPKSESGVYQLHLFAKNQIETGDHIVKMKIPSFKSGFSRHLYVILRNWHQSTLVFKTPEPQEFFSRDTINGTVPPGLHVLDVKEISDGKFYIAQSDVIQKIEGIDSSS